MVKFFFSLSIFVLEVDEYFRHGSRFSWCDEEIFLRENVDLQEPLSFLGYFFEVIKLLSFLRILLYMLKLYCYVRPVRSKHVETNYLWQRIKHSERSMTQEKDMTLLQRKDLGQVAPHIISGTYSYLTNYSIQSLRLRRLEAILTLISLKEELIRMSPIPTEVVLHDVNSLNCNSAKLIFMRVVCHEILPLLRYLIPFLLLGSRCSPNSSHVLFPRGSRPLGVVW